MKKLINLTLILLLTTLVFSCSSVSAYMYLEPVQDKSSDQNNGKLENQLDLAAFLNEIKSSKDSVSVEVFGRKTLSPFIVHTKLLTHSFYLIKLKDEYYTLSFSGANFKPYTEGLWVLNKETDISSYRLFKEGNNIWDLCRLFTEEIIDVRQTLESIIDAIYIGANYYYRDHVKSRPNSFNCNSAVTETIVLVR